MNTEKIDMHLSEAATLIDVVTFIAELDEPDRARLRPGAITILYVIRDMLRTANKELAN